MAVDHQGERTTTELAELLRVGRSTVYRTLGRAKVQAMTLAAGDPQPRLGTDPRREICCGWPVDSFMDADAGLVDRK